MSTISKGKISFSDKLIRTIFDSLSAHIAIIDEHGDILETNHAWNKFSTDNGGKEPLEKTGYNYLLVCESAGLEGNKDAQNVVTGIRDVIAKKTNQFLYDYPCHSPDEQRWFYMRAVLMEDDGPVRVIISHEDITQLKLAQEALKEKTDTLKEKNISLEEVNIALKVLIQQREIDKSDLENKILSNLKTTVFPYIEKLKSAPLKRREETWVNILDEHLNDIISPMLQNLSNANIVMTPQEVQVATLVKDGRTTAEIADVLFVSESTVSFHRKNIREKLGLKNKQTNLRSFLLTMSK